MLLCFKVVEGFATAWSSYFVVLFLVKKKEKQNSRKIKMEEETKEGKGEIEKVCSFKDVLGSCKDRESGTLLLNLTENRLKTVKKASRKRKDNLDLCSFSSSS